MSIQVHPDKTYQYELHTGMYFSWANKLWYVEDISSDGERAFLEDCGTERARWMKTRLFERDMKEVIPNKC